MSINPNIDHQGIKANRLMIEIKNSLESIDCIRKISDRNNFNMLDHMYGIHDIQE